MALRLHGRVQLRRKRLRQRRHHAKRPAWSVHVGGHRHPQFQLQVFRMVRHRRLHFDGQSTCCDECELGSDHHRVVRAGDVRVDRQLRHRIGILYGWNQRHDRRQCRANEQDFRQMDGRHRHGGGRELGHDYADHARFRRQRDRDLQGHPLRSHGQFGYGLGELRRWNQRHDHRLHRPIRQGLRQMDRRHRDSGGRQPLLDNAHNASERRRRHRHIQRHTADLLHPDRQLRHGIGKLPGQHHRDDLRHSSRFRKNVRQVDRRHSKYRQHQPIVDDIDNASQRRRRHSHIQGHSADLLHPDHQLRHRIGKLPGQHRRDDLRHGTGLRQNVRQMDRRHCECGQHQSLLYDAHNASERGRRHSHIQGHTANLLHPDRQLRHGIGQLPGQHRRDDLRHGSRLR